MNRLMERRPLSAAKVDKSQTTLYCISALYIYYVARRICYFVFIQTALYIVKFKIYNVELKIHNVEWCINRVQSVNRVNYTDRVQSINQVHII